MLIILIKQLVNFWKTLEIRYKLELLTLLIIVFAVINSKLSSVIQSWIENGASYSGTTLLISNLFSLLICVNLLAIITWILPNQNGLKNFLSKPLNNIDTVKIISFYCTKYLSYLVILLIPLQSAITTILGLKYALFSLFIILGLTFSFLMILIFLRTYLKRKSMFLSMGMLAIVSYYAGFSFFYLSSIFLIEFQIILISMLTMITTYILIYDRKNIDLEKFSPFQLKTYHKKSFKKNEYKLPEIFKYSTQALFEKEFFSLWRNSKYKRLKIYTFLLFLFLIILAGFYIKEYVEIWIPVITCIFIWMHFSSRFNEKYSYSEPDWLILTVPIKFKNLFIAKYFNEVFALAFFLVIPNLFLLFYDIEIKNLIKPIIYLVLFAHFVLFSMINFQIMFYNNARLAQYAFHFSVLFFGIMIINYPLVGPIVTIGLMAFFFYKNIRYLST